MQWPKSCWSDWTRRARPPDIGRSGTLASVKSVRALPVLILTLLLGAGFAHAEQIYRVEVLVFTHQAGTSDRWPEQVLRDFSALPDPLHRAALAAWTARRAALEAPAGSDPEVPDQPLALDPGSSSGPASRSGAATSSPSVRRAEGDLPLWPEFFMELGELSTGMQRAAGRISASAGHELLASLSWLQPLDRRTSAAAVRIHDQTPLELAWLAPNASEYQLDSMIIGPRPVPTAHYRLDGSFRLRQRQFRHVELDLVWREPVFDRVSLTGDEPERFQIHRLQQSRPIQLGRLEYFDSAWLGVLVLVERWERPDLPEGTERGD